jgi:UDP-N-acetylglucosamine 3-dehydrogenase
MSKRVAVIGLGVMGSHHARILNSLGVLSAVYDPDVSRASAKGQQYDVPNCTSLDVLLAMPLDAVCVAAPTPFHLDIGAQCLTAGLDVFMEKPLADTYISAGELVNVADISGKIFTVGYIERFNPAFRALQRLVKEEAFGEITSVNMKRVGGLPRSADNVILDLMTHDINLLMALFGTEPNAVYTHHNTVDKIVNSAQVLFSFGKAAATCEANWVSPIKVRRIEVTGTSGYCDVNLIQQRVTRYETYGMREGAQSFKDFASFQDFVATYGEPRHQIVDQFHQEPLKDELEAFVHALETRDTSQLVSGQDALNTLKVTLQACGKGK